MRRVYVTPVRGHLSWKCGAGEDQGPSIVTGDGSSPARLRRPGYSPSSCPASLCGLGTVSGPLWASGPTWGPGLQPNPTQPHTAAHPGQGQRVGGVKALPPVDVVAVRGVQDGQRDAHPVGGGSRQRRCCCGRRRRLGGPPCPPARPAGLRPGSAPRPPLPRVALPAPATHLTCAGSTRVSGRLWSRGVRHRRQGVPGSEGTRNRRRLTR